MTGTRVALLVPFLLSLLSGIATAVERAPVIGSVIGRDDGLPIAAATIVLLENGHVVATVKTDLDGRFRFDPVANGSYQIGVVASGSRPVTEPIEVAGAPAVKQLAVDRPQAETVDIYERMAVTEAEPPPSLNPRRPLPYSDEAADADVWGSATLLVYVDEHGRPVATRVLKAAGHGLDPIGIRQVLGSTYKPARDGQGRSMRSAEVIRLEWPAFWWMREMGLNNLDALYYPLPCKDSGRPLNFDFPGPPMYRDCGAPAPNAVATAAYTIPVGQKDRSISLAPERQISSLSVEEKEAICSWTAEMARPYGTVTNAATTCQARMEAASRCDATVEDVLLCTMNKARDPSICGLCTLPGGS